MFGYCRVVSEKRGVRLETIRLCGMPLCALEVKTGRWEARRLSRGGKKLARSGVRRVLTPEGFPHWELLERWGLSAPDPIPLLRRMVPDLALKWLAVQGKPAHLGVVALRGRRGGELTAAAEALCPEVGGLVLDTPDGEALARQLRANYGMAPLGKEYRGKVDISINFAPDLRGDGDCMLELWPGAARKPGLRLAIQGMPEPEFCDGLPLLAALWDSGRLDPCQIEIDFA